MAPALRNNDSALVAPVSKQAKADFFCGVYRELDEGIACK